MLGILKTITEEWRETWRPSRDRVLWAPVFLAAGIAMYFGLSQEPAPWAGAGAASGLAAMALAASRRAPAYAYGLTALFLVAFGFAVAQARTHMVASPMLEREINFTRVEGRVRDVTVADINPKTGRQRSRKVTLDSLIVEKLPPEATPRSVRLTTYHVPDDVAPGDRIALLARLMPPSGPVVPDGFSYRQMVFFEQMGATGFTMGRFEMIAKADAPKFVWFNALRQKIAARISGEMPHPQSAVATALLAGERSSIPESVNNDLRDSGLYHLLSISGLHVAIVCGVTFFALRFLMAFIPWLALNWPIKKIAAFFALAAGVFYSLLAGMPVPTERALFMTGLALIAVMTDRAALSMRTVALAAFFVLLLQPESVTGASFQLSFAAMLAMIAFYEGAGRVWGVASRDDGWIKRLLVYFAGIVVTTILVSMATLPAILHHFGRFQILGVIANAVAIPLTSFVLMPAGMAAMILMPLHLEEPFLKLAGFAIDGTLWIAHEVASMPYATFAWPSLSLPYYLAAIFGFLFVCLWRGRMRWTGVPVMALAIVLGLQIGTRPVAMLNDNLTALGVSGGGQIAYFNRAPGKFERDNWKSVWGGTEANAGKAIKDPLWQAGDVSVSCDDWACRIVRAGSRHGLSVVRSANVLPEECNWAQMVVTLDKAVGDARQDHCAARMISAWDVMRGGGMAFYADAQGWRAKPFTPANARRPWTLRPR